MTNEIMTELPKAVYGSDKFHNILSGISKEDIREIINYFSPINLVIDNTTDPNILSFFVLVRSYKSDDFKSHSLESITAKQAEINELQSTLTSFIHSNENIISTIKETREDINILKPKILESNDKYLKKLISYEDNLRISYNNLLHFCKNNNTTEENIKEKIANFEKNIKEIKEKRPKINKDKLNNKIIYDWISSYEKSFEYNCIELFNNYKSHDELEKKKHESEKTLREKIKKVYNEIEKDVQEDYRVLVLGGNWKYISEFKEVLKEIIENDKVDVIASIADKVKFKYARIQNTMLVHTEYDKDNNNPKFNLELHL